MRNEERRVRGRLTSRGLPAPAIRRRVDWLDVRRRLERGESVESVADTAARGIFAPLLPMDLAGEAAGDVLGIIGRLVEPFLPKTPPLPAGFSTEIELDNCRVVFVGMVGDGDYAKIEVSNNGFPLIDEPGIVEIITVPPIPGPPGQPSFMQTVRGNGSVFVDGPRTIYLHLKGEEDACDVEITVFPKQSK